MILVGVSAAVVFACDPALRQQVSVSLVGNNLYCILTVHCICGYIFKMFINIDHTIFLENLFPSLLSVTLIMLLITDIVLGGWNHVFLLWYRPLVMLWCF